MERQYQDQELANRIKGIFFDKIPSLKKEDITHKGSSLFIKYRSIEYAIVVGNKNGQGTIELHVERPAESLRDTLKKSLTDDSIFGDKDFGFLKKGNLRKYRRVFERGGIRDGFSGEYVEEGQENTIAVVTKIKNVPLSGKGRLSGNFADYFFEYVVRPVFAQTERYVRR